MSLRRQALLGILAALAAIAALLAVVVSRSAAQREEAAKAAFADGLLTAVAQARVLAVDTLLHPSPRATEQFVVMQSELHERLRAAPAGTPHWAALIGDIQHSAALVDRLFRRLSAPIPALAEAQRRELDARTMTSLMVVTDQMRDASVSLGRIAAEEAAHRQGVTSALLYTILLALAGIVALLARLLLQQVLQPLAAIQAGMQRVAAGDFGVRVGVTGAGEVATLSQSFDQLAGTLQSYVRQLEERAQFVRPPVLHALRPARPVDALAADSAYAEDVQRLRTALSRDELRLHFQPQIDAAGRCSGAEALIRWAHPERGLVGPDAIIPLAEESGLIRDVGRWVVEEACREAARWRSEGFAELSLSVNASPLQLRDGALVDELRAALRESRVPAAMLEIEVTESSLQTEAAAIAALDEIRALGVRVAIDDFGTGYSCLSSLKALPLDRLKIDRAFVRTLPHDLHGAAVVEVILVIAERMSLKVTAEGVETPEQLHFLQRRGCEKFQGMLAGPVMEGAELRRFLAFRS